MDQVNQNFQVLNVFFFYHVVALVHINVLFYHFLTTKKKCFFILLSHVYTLGHALMLKVSSIKYFLNGNNIYVQVSQLIKEFGLVIAIHLLL